MSVTLPLSNRFPASGPAWIAFAVTLLLGGVLLSLVERGRLADARKTAFEAAERMVRQLDRQLSQDLSATYALAALVRQGRGEVSEFSEVAGELVAMHAGVSSLQLAPDGVVRQIEPLAGNEKAIGHDLLADDTRNKEVRLAMATGQLTLAGPFELRQGGEAMIGRLPVQVEGRFWGFVNALIRMPDYLAAVRIADLEQQGYAYALWRRHPDSGAAQVFARSRLALSNAPVSASFEVPNGRWTLDLTPAAGWWQPLRWVGEAIVLLVLAGLAGWVAWLRGKTAAALAEREKHYRTLYESTPAMMHSINTEGRMVAVSDLWLKTLGYAREEVIGRRSTDFLTEDSRRHAIETVLPEFYRTGHVEDIAYQMLAKNGQVLDVLISSTSERDAQGHILRSLAVIQDVTERRRAEAARQVADDRLRLVMEATDDGIWDWLPDTGEMYLSTRWKSMLGYAESELNHRYEQFVDLLHPDDREAVTRALRAHLDDAASEFRAEFRLRQRDGEWRWVLSRGLAQRDADGRVRRVVGANTDISASKEYERTLLHIAHYDPLTGLANRHLLTDRMRQAQAVNLRQETLLAVCYLDLDGFKPINDHYGHEQGDLVLQTIARRLLDTLRAGDTVARLGGDEFVMLLTSLPDVAECDTVIGRVLARISEPIALAGGPVVVSASIGVALHPLDDGEADALLRHADQAMYRAKSTGKNRYSYFDARMA